MKFGILANDILVSANGELLQDLDLFDAIDLIKGPAGTSVDLEVLRE
ncbi:MAG: PDZ domain-containing protein [Patescibacteria group bacterium]